MLITRKGIRQRFVISFRCLRMRLFDRILSMHVDLIPEEKWESLNSQVAEFLKATADHQIRVSRGLATSVHEIVASAAQFYSHKRSIVYVKGATHAFNGVLPGLYKDGFQIAQIALSDFTNLQWIETLKKDTNLVMYSEDHPVTGEVYPWQEVDKKLNELKILSIRVSHSLHYSDRSLPLPYSVRICSLNPNLSVIVCGNKYRAPALTISREFWPVEAVFDEIQSQYSAFSENKVQVAAFESNLPAGFSAFFKHQNRVFDRAVIFNPVVSGEALQNSLSKKLQWLLRSPGWETRLETTNLCRWGGVSLYNEWWDPKPNDDILRGMLIIGSQNLPSITTQVLLDALAECQI